MTNFVEDGLSVTVVHGKKKWLFPKGVLMTHTEKDSDSIEIRLMGSRKNIVSFLYTDCNVAGADAYETVTNIEKIIN